MIIFPDQIFLSKNTEKNIPKMHDIIKYINL